MTVISPEVLRENIESQVESLSPRMKREAVSALERAFADIQQIHGPVQRCGYLVLANKAGVPLFEVFEGKSPNSGKAKKLFDEARTLAQMLSMDEESFSGLYRGAVRGKRLIIAFAGFTAEADEAAALYVAIQMDELTREEANRIADKTRNNKFKELMQDVSKKES